MQLPTAYLDLQAAASAGSRNAFEIMQSLDAISLCEICWPTASKSLFTNPVRSCLSAQGMRMPEHVLSTLHLLAACVCFFIDGHGVTRNPERSMSEVIESPLLPS